MTATLGICREDGVAIFELRNPPLNLLTLGLRSSLHEATLDVAADPEVRVVVIRSGIAGVFSAGSDVNEFPGSAPEGVLRSAQEHACFNAIARMPQPVIAQLSGHVLGGGLELALACDIRVAADDASLALPEAGLGVFPTGGGTQRLPRLVGASRAKLMMFLGERVDATEALDAGLVDSVAPSASLQDFTLELAERIAQRPRDAVRAIKAAVDHGLAFGPAAGEAMEEELSTIFASPDAREGVRAFLESRPPLFSDAPPRGSTPTTKSARSRES